MRTPRSALLLVVTGFGLALGAAGCASESTDAKITDKEHLLSAAGFTIKPATTPAQQANLALLPAHTLFGKTKDGRVHYLYVDPTVCKCVYAGDETAYQTYQRFVFEKHLAEEREWTAQMNEDAAVDWGAWGPWY